MSRIQFRNTIIFDGIDGLCRISRMGPLQCRSRVPPGRKRKRIT